MIKILTFLTALFFFSFSFSQAKLETKKPVVKKVTTTNIYTYLAGSDQHTTLVAALKAADLIDTISGPGPFTLFAPTNAAFNGLPKGALDNLLKPENIEKLKNILTYHVLSGNFDAKTIVNAISANDGETEFKTVNGTSVSGYVKGGTVILTDVNGNQVNVTKADIQESNGTIHIIDGVILPE